MMTEYTFTSMDELMEFCDSRKNDKEAKYYWGFIENFDGEKHTTIFVGTAIAEDAQEIEFMDKDEVKTFKVEEAND